MLEKEQPCNRRDFRPEHVDIYEFAVRKYRIANFAKGPLPLSLDASRRKSSLQDARHRDWKKEAEVEDEINDFLGGKEHAC